MISFIPWKGGHRQADFMRKHARNEADRPHPLFDHQSFPKFFEPRPEAAGRWQKRNFGRKGDQPTRFAQRMRRAGQAITVSRLRQLPRYALYEFCTGDCVAYSALEPVTAPARWYSGWALTGAGASGAGFRQGTGCATQPHIEAWRWNGCACGYWRGGQDGWRHETGPFPNTSQRFTTIVGSAGDGRLV